jgi:argininosuccinate synthase
VRDGAATTDICSRSAAFPALILYYDDYHTPLEPLRRALYATEILAVSLGGRSASAPPPGPDVTWLDRSDWFADRYLARAIRADARYQQHYALSAALARPALAEIAGEVASRGHDVVHGFAGNDRLRFEIALAILCPHVTIRAVAELLGSRTQANRDGFTRSANLWGETCEAGALGDPAARSAELMFAEPARTAAAGVAIGFERGLPVSLDGVPLGLGRLVAQLDRIGRDAGVAWHDLVEDGHVGLKTRALYHNPAADILAAAHRDLVRITGSRRATAFRRQASAAWAELVYDGGWFDPLRADLDAYFERADAHATGTVHVAIRGGQIRVVARDAAHPLYDEASAVYRAGQDFGDDLIRGLRDQAVRLGRLARARDVRHEDQREGGVPCSA